MATINRRALPLLQWTAIFVHESVIGIFYIAPLRFSISALIFLYCIFIIVMQDGCDVGVYAYVFVQSQGTYNGSQKKKNPTKPNIKNKLLIKFSSRP